MTSIGGARRRRARVVVALALPIAALVAYRRRSAHTRSWATAALVLGSAVFAIGVAGTTSGIRRTEGAVAAPGLSAAERALIADAGPHAACRAAARGARGARGRM